MEKKQKIIEVLDKHFNNYWNTTSLSKQLIADEILEALRQLDVKKSVCVCQYNYPTYWMCNIERCNYCNQEKAKQTDL